jgi:hypothetical protein
MFSTGQFDMSLAGIFRPESKAVFTWKETGNFAGSRPRFSTIASNSRTQTFCLNASGGVAKVSYYWPDLYRSGRMM